MELVTIEQARAHCHAFEHDDAMLQVYVDAAEQAVQDFLNRRVYADADSLAEAVADGSAGDDPILTNSAIVAAALLITGNLFQNREEVIVGTIATRMPMGVTALLWPHRRGIGV